MSWDSFILFPGTTLIQAPCTGVSSFSSQPSEQILLFKCSLCGAPKSEQLMLEKIPGATEAIPPARAGLLEHAGILMERVGAGTRQYP